MLAEQRQQLVAHDLEHLLIGRKLQHHLRPHSPGANLRQQFVGHADVHVAVEQRLAYPRQRGVQMLVGKLPLPAQVLEYALQLVCKIFKHKLSQCRALPGWEHRHSCR